LDVRCWVEPRAPKYQPTQVPSTSDRTLWSSGRVVSHDSAALVHELGQLDPLRVHRSVPHGFRGLDPTVVTHVDELRDGRPRSRSWRVTTPLRTLLDLATGSTSQERLDSTVASALDHGLTTLRRIRSRSDEAGDRA